MLIFFYCVHIPKVIKILCKVVSQPMSIKDGNVNLTVVELKRMAKERGIKGYSTMKKAELCKLLSIPPKQPLSPTHGILRKRPTDALLPVSVNIGGTVIIVYIKPADRGNFKFPCIITSGEFLEYEGHDYQKLSKHITREEYSYMANLELDIEKKALQNKVKNTKVRFK